MENQTHTVCSLQCEMIAFDLKTRGMSKDGAIPSTDPLEMLMVPRVLILIQQEFKFGGGGDSVGG